MPNVNFNGEKLRAIAKESNWTLVQISKIIGKQDNFISNICYYWSCEKMTLEAICELLQCTMKDIGVGEKKGQPAKTKEESKEKPKFDVPEIQLVNEALEVIGKRLYQMEEEQKNFHVSANSMLNKIYNQMKYGGR